MSCRRAYDLDLPAFLASPRDAAWDEFRGHYPRCAECSSEVAAWTALHATLAPQHPEPAELLRWSDDPGSLLPDARAIVARHLEQCASCRDELRALDRFTVTVASTTTDGPVAAADARAGEVERAAHVAAAARPGGRHGEARARSRPASAPEHRRADERRAGGVLRRTLWHPAFAYAALALVLLLPTFRSSFEREAARDAFDAGSRRIAEEQQGESPSLQAPAPPPAAEPRPGREQQASGAVRDDASAGVAERRMEQVARPEAALADRADDAHVDRTAPRLLRQAPPRPAGPPPAPAAAPVAQAPAAGARAAFSAAESADSARAKAAAPAGDAAGTDTLRALGSALEGDAAVRLLAKRDGAARTLAIVLPSGLAGDAVIDVRIRDEAGERELRQRVHRAAGTPGEITLEIPAGLSAPRLLVEVYADGVGPVVRGEVVP